jgi:hypothetical protein
MFDDCGDINMQGDFESGRDKNKKTNSLSLEQQMQISAVDVPWNCPRCSVQLRTAVRQVELKKITAPTQDKMFAVGT